LIPLGPSRGTGASTRSNVTSKLHCFHLALTFSLPSSFVSYFNVDVDLIGFFIRSDNKSNVIHHVRL
jgi:hypothetical protein